MEQSKARFLNVIIWLASGKIKEGELMKNGLKKACVWVSKLLNSELWNKFGRVILDIQA